MGGRRRRGSSETEKILVKQLTINICCFVRVTLPSVKGEKKRTAWYEEQQQQLTKEEKKPGFTLTPPFPGIAAAGRTEASRPKSRWRERSSNPDVRFPRKKKVSSGGVSRKKKWDHRGEKKSSFYHGWKVSDVILRLVHSLRPS